MNPAMQEEAADTVARFDSRRHVACASSQACESSHSIRSTCRSQLDLDAAVTLLTAPEGVAPTSS